MLTTADQSVNSIAELTPSTFKFSTYRGASRDVLNMCISFITSTFPLFFLAILYIATTSPAQNPQFGLQFPLPDVSNVDVIMFIHNKIQFRNILAPGFRNAGLSASVISFFKYY